MDGKAQSGAFPHTLRVERDGGLLSHMNVWQNIRLPLEYHARNTAHAEEDAALLFGLCGEAETARLMGSYPDALSAYELRLAGFVRAMLLEPEVLVLEDVFDGFSAAEREKAMQWEKVFRLRFPFRELFYHEAGGGT